MNVMMWMLLSPNMRIVNTISSANWAQEISVYATSKMLKKDPNLEITSFRLMRKFIVEAIFKY